MLTEDILIDSTRARQFCKEGSAKKWRLHLKIPLSDVARVVGVQAETIKRWEEIQSDPGLFGTSTRSRDELMACAARYGQLLQRMSSLC